jgi:hypothetical protein
MLSVRCDAEKVTVPVPEPEIPAIEYPAVELIVFPFGV